MLKNILTCDRDLKETAVIEKRRCAEEERKRRFFNEKQRVLGIDCDALRNQINEKEQKIEAEREAERIEAEEMKKNLEISQAREQELMEQKRQNEKELNQYRRNCQLSKDGSDFDLNDPDGKKKAYAARLGDEDPRLSVSGGQLFIGEDLALQNRIREQKMQQKNFLDQQILEKQNLKQNRKQSDKVMSDSLCMNDNHAVFLGNRMNENSRQIQRQILEYNQSLAQQKRDNDKKQKELDQRDNLAEIYNFLSSDLLQENQPKGSNLGPNRCIPYSYKGMSPEQIEAHKLEQEKQMNDIRLRQMEEKNQQKQWENLTEETHRQMTLKERALSRKIRDINCQVREENQKLAEEQKFKIEHYEKTVNTNQPTNEYFDQFNTSSR